MPSAQIFPAARATRMSENGRRAVREKYNWDWE